MRGKHVTKPIEEGICEARELVGDGVRELVLVAQDTTYYGRDLYGTSRLVDLLEKLEVVIPQEGLVLNLKKRRKIFVTSSYIVY